MNSKERIRNQSQTDMWRWETSNQLQSEYRYFPLALARVVSSVFITIVILVPQRRTTSKRRDYSDCLQRIACVSPPLLPHRMCTRVFSIDSAFFLFLSCSYYVLLYRFYFSHRQRHEAPSLPLLLVFLLLSPFYQPEHFSFVFASGVCPSALTRSLLSSFSCVSSAALRR